MTLGTSIFLSSLVLGAVFLYGFTKDRWNWKRLGLGIAAALVLIVGAGVAGFSLLDRRQRRDSEAEAELNRTRYEVVIGDPLSKVLQRQGAPDTLFRQADGGIVLGYWDDYETVNDTEKAFFFTPDSTLGEIRFFGTTPYDIEYGWKPRDGVNLGISGDSALALLGQPCSERVEDSFTHLEFRTSVAGVLRFIRLSHGDRQVVRHGWVQRDC